jgi:acyl-CoA synthetase (AMP-forming)/AMP-acid ligase II
MGAERVPRAAPAPDLREQVRRAWREFPDRLAFVNERVRWRFGEVGERARRVAALLDSMGASSGDTVGYVLSPRLELLYETRLASIEHGSTLFGISPTMPPSQLVPLLRSVGPRVVIYDADLLPGVADRLRDAIPAARPLAARGPNGPYEGLLPGMPDRQSANPVDPGALGALGFTSGTTGAPKGITATQRALAESCRMFLDILKRERIEGPGTFFNAMPLFAAGGGMIVPALASGLTMRVMDGFDAASALALLESDRAAALFVTPSMLIDLLDEDLESRDLSALRLVIYGSAATPAARVEEAVRRLGPRLLHGYGMSECLPPISVLWPEEHGTSDHPADHATLRSAGRPFEGVRVRIEDPSGRVLGTGEVGEVVIQSPTVTAGYWNDPERTAATLTAGWWHSGDLGFLDDHGRVNILDRQADVIARGGRAVFPRRIEEAASEHPAVKEACAVADTAGRIVLAVSWRRAVRAEADPTASLSRALEERLDPGERPDAIRVFGQLPRSVQGKVLKREIRDVVARPH